MVRPAPRKPQKAISPYSTIACLPQPQHAITERFDSLATKTLPGLQRSVKWGMTYYGVDGGWCFCCGAFQGHVKVMFINGTQLKPVLPVTPVDMGTALPLVGRHARCGAKDTGRP